MGPYIFKTCTLDIALAPAVKKIQHVASVGKQKRHKRFCPCLTSNKCNSTSPQCIPKLVFSPPKSWNNKYLSYLFSGIRETDLPWACLMLDVGSWTPGEVFWIACIQGKPTNGKILTQALSHQDRSLQSCSSILGPLGSSDSEEEEEDESTLIY